MLALLPPFERHTTVLKRLDPLISLQNRCVQRIHFLESMTSIVLTKFSQEFLLFFFNHGDGYENIRTRDAFKFLDHQWNVFGQEMLQYVSCHDGVEFMIFEGYFGC